MHLAELKIAVTKYPLDHLRMADFKRAQPAARIEED
jgi:hypothetical protein